MTVAEIRVDVVNRAGIRPDGDFVLYWMIASRRPSFNFALEQAVGYARELRKPLLVLEALRVGYRWASDRFHAFVLQGMADNARYFGATAASYYPYVEQTAGDAKGLLQALGARAAVVVTDDFPAFFLRRMVSAAGDRLPVRLEAIDSNGLTPLRASDRAFPTAYGFRRFLQNRLRDDLAVFPADEPLAGVELPRIAALPPELTARWPAATEDLLSARPAALARLALDHDVGVVDGPRGGAGAASEALERFLDTQLTRYGDDRNQPEKDVTSGLSPYLHFGHISTHQVFAALMTRERWTSRQLAQSSRGARQGWWGVSAAAEGFLDQLVTWREVGYNMCHHRQDYDQFASLPAWAVATLARHAGDRREHVYGLERFESAATHDELWNAAQRQLVREGRMHNYLRMLWGKKILEWSPAPQDALAVMIELNNKYAIDGRDPNSYSGIFWVLGRYDRPWAPERPVFGTVRFMSSSNTARKVRVRQYLQRYAARGRETVRAVGGQ